MVAACRRTSTVTADALNMPKSRMGSVASKALHPTDTTRDTPPSRFQYHVHAYHHVRKHEI